MFVFKIHIFFRVYNHLPLKFLFSFNSVSHILVGPHLFFFYIDTNSLFIPIIIQYLIRIDFQKWKLPEEKKIFNTYFIALFCIIYLSLCISFCRNKLPQICKLVL